MKRSSKRILTTIAGSLPRPPDLLELLAAREGGKPVDEQALRQRTRTAVAETVRQEAESGVDVVSDGELGKPSFSTYVRNRLSGMEGVAPPAGGGGLFF